MVDSVCVLVVLFVSLPWCVLFGVESSVFVVVLLDGVFVSLPWCVFCHGTCLRCCCFSLPWYNCIMVYLCCFWCCFVPYGVEMCIMMNVSNCIFVSVHGFVLYSCHILCRHLGGSGDIDGVLLSYECMHVQLVPTYGLSWVEVVHLFHKAMHWNIQGNWYLYKI